MNQTQHNKSRGQLSKKEIFWVESEVLQNVKGVYAITFLQTEKAGSICSLDLPYANHLWFVTLSQIIIPFFVSLQPQLPFPPLHRSYERQSHLCRDFRFRWHSFEHRYPSSYSWLFVLIHLSIFLYALIVTTNFLICSWFDSRVWMLISSVTSI